MLCLAYNGKPYIGRIFASCHDPEYKKYRQIFDEYMLTTRD